MITSTLMISVLLAAASAIMDIRCMNFYGLETQRAGLVCDWQHDPIWYLDRLQRDLGINTIRLPFSYELVKYHSMDTMDRFMKDCHARNLSVILDWHRTWAGHQGATPEEGITRQEFIDTWIRVVKRYPDIMGIGVFNEIQTEDFDYANSLHADVIAQVEKEVPGKLLYFAGCPGWGGDCSLMNLTHTPTWNRTFIEVHKYVFSGASDIADWNRSMPESIPADHWFVGEVGWKHDVPKEREWAERFLTYLNARNITNVCAWTIAHSGDTEGWWKDDCETFNYEKASLLRSFWDNSLKRIRTMSTTPPVKLLYREQVVTPLLRTHSCAR